MGGCRGVLIDGVAPGDKKFIKIGIIEGKRGNYEKKIGDILYSKFFFLNLLFLTGILH